MLGGDVIISALDSGSSSLGSRPVRGGCFLGQDTRASYFTLTVPLSKMGTNEFNVVW